MTVSLAVELVVVLAAVVMEALAGLVRLVDLLAGCLFELC